MVATDPLGPLITIMREAFGLDAEYWRKYRETVGDDNYRSVTHNGALAGGLVLVPMGQFFGGRSVPMTGIACVAIAPEFRGTGVATRLMRDAVRELHDTGIALSALYPATEPLYRRAGYEQAGTATRIRLELASIRERDTTLPVTRVTDANMDAVRAIYRECAAANPGNLDRSDLNWWEIRRETEGFLFGEDAYLFYKTQGLPGEPRRVMASLDHAIRSRAGLLRLLTFLADHQSLRHDALLFVAPSDSLLAGITEQRYRPLFIDHWMLRITHLEAALQARGYTRALDAELHLRIADDLIDAHNGDWTLRVADGNGQVTQGGRGEVALDIRALASLYSGHLSVATLRSIGWIAGPDAALETAQGIFSGPAPWMSDGF